MVWDVSGIPCKHAVRCILVERKDVETFVDDAYTIERCRATYDGIMHPIPDPVFWVQRNLPELKPPPIDRKKIGRPETARKGDARVTPKGFSRCSTMRCTKCKQLGHNSRSHKGKNGAFVPKRLKPKPVRKVRLGPKRPRGRPTKKPNQMLEDPLRLEMRDLNSSMLVAALPFCPRRGASL